MICSWRWEGMLQCYYMCILHVPGKSTPERIVTSTFWIKFRIKSLTSIPFYFKCTNRNSCKYNLPVHKLRWIHLIAWCRKINTIFMNFTEWPLWVTDCDGDWNVVPKYHRFDEGSDGMRFKTKIIAFNRSQAANQNPSAFFSLFCLS